MASVGKWSIVGFSTSVLVYGRVNRFTHHGYPLTNCVHWGRSWASDHSSHARMSRIYFWVLENHLRVDGCFFKTQKPSQFPDFKNRCVFKETVAFLEGLLFKSWQAVSVWLSLEVCGEYVVGQRHKGCCVLMLLSLWPTVWAHRHISCSQLSLLREKEPTPNVGMQNLDVHLSSFVVDNDSWNML